MAMILYLSAGIWAVDRNDEDQVCHQSFLHCYYYHYQQLREDIQQFLIVSLDDYMFNRDFNETWNDMQREVCYNDYNVIKCYSLTAYSSSVVVYSIAHRGCFDITCHRLTEKYRLLAVLILPV